MVNVAFQCCRLDVTEAQFMHIAILLFSATFGSKVWLYKVGVATCAISGTASNYCGYKFHFVV